MDKHDENDAPLVAVQPINANPFAFANEKAVNTVAKALQNASTAKDAPADTTDAQARQVASQSLLAAFAADMSEAGKAVADLLQIEDPEARKLAAVDLAKKLDTLLAADPEMAAVIETALAETFADQAKELTL